MFGVALGLRLLHLWEFSRNSPFFELPFSDSFMYMAVAEKIAEGDWLGDGQAFLQAPGYRYFAGLLLWVHAKLGLAVGALTFVRLVQSVCGALSCVLLAVLAGQLADRRVGLVAGLMAAAYGPLIFFDLEWLPTSLLVLILMVGFRWIYRLQSIETGREPGIPWPRWMALGLVLGCGSLVRMNLLPFALVLCPWAWWTQRWRGSWRAPLATGLAFALGLALPLGLCSYRNYKGSGHGGLVYGGGLNFYLGNNPNWKKTSEARPGPEWRRIFVMPGVSPEVDPGRWSSDYFRRSVSWVLADPSAFGGALLAKARRLASGHERRRNFDLYRFRRYSRVIQMLVWHPTHGLAFPFALLGPLSLLGLLFRWRDHWRRDLPLLLFIGAYGLPFLLFFITARYRLPLAVVLLFFAAVALVELGRRLPRSLLWLLPVIALGVLASHDRQPDDPHYEAELHAILGNAAFDAGRHVEARRELSEALRLWNGYPDALGRLALIAEREGKLPEALHLYGLAIAGDHWSWEFFFNRGRLHERSGRYSEALSDYSEALRLRPDVAFMLIHVGRAYLALNRNARAIEMFRRALERKPGDSVATQLLEQAERR